jgi:hypothetical protein
MTKFHINMLKADYHNLIACIPWLKMKQFHINNLQIKAYYHNTKEKRVTTFTITTRKVI